MNQKLDIQITEDVKRIYFRIEPNINIGSKVQKDQLLGYYSINTNSLNKKLYSPIQGTIKYIQKEQNKNLIYIQVQNSPSNILLIEIENCTHELVYNGTCTNCYQVVPKKKEGFKIFNQINNISANQDIIVQELNYLKEQKKLIMILDLDQTVLHAVHANFKQLQEFKDSNQTKDYYIMDFGNQYYILKFRPYLKFFLDRTYKEFEIFVYTFGTRDYAEAIIAKLDPDEIYFKVNQKESKNYNKK